MAHNILSKLKDWYKRRVWRRYLPCTVFCRDPLVLVCYDTDFIRNAEPFLKVFGKSRAKSFHVFLQLGWERETPENSVEFAETIKSVEAKCDRLKITVLANSENEVSVLSGLGLRAVFCNQNAFVDEANYPILHAPKRYDAIYIARITPFKRHALAEQIPSLRLVGEFAWLDSEKPYASDILRNRLKHADWTGHVNAASIPAEIAAARCGLCLSAAEGAMFVSIEYLLCGVPVVNTPNIGGRDALFPDFAVKTVQDTPEAVADAVREFAEHAPAPEEIRAATLEKMELHRRTFRRLLNEAMSPEKLPDDYSFPHKLLLRRINTPFILRRYGLRRQG
jgi:glycosyltransferase involved in cell wall biosynthesis